MASVQEPGIVRWYRITPSGNKILIYSGNTAALGPSGSADGVIASTPEKWTYVAPITDPNKVLRVNDQLLVTFESFAADGVDVSDCESSVPITYQDGTPDVLRAIDDSTEWDVKVAADKTLVANDETPLCVKTVRRPFAFGGGKMFFSIEDDTA